MVGSVINKKLPSIFIAVFRKWYNSLLLERVPAANRLKCLRCGLDYEIRTYFNNVGLRAVPNIPCLEHWKCVSTVDFQCIMEKEKAKLEGNWVRPLRPIYSNRLASSTLHHSPGRPRRSLSSRFAAGNASPLRTDNTVSLNWRFFIDTFLLADLLFIARYWR